MLAIASARLACAQCRKTHSSATNSRKSDRQNALSTTSRHRRAMNMPNAVLFFFLTAFVSCLCLALHSLAHTPSLFSLVISCVVTFAIMATASYAVDHGQDHS